VLVFLSRHIFINILSTGYYKNYLNTFYSFIITVKIIAQIDLKIVLYLGLKDLGVGLFKIQKIFYIIILLLYNKQSKTGGRILATYQCFIEQQFY